MNATKLLQTVSTGGPPVSGSALWLDSADQSTLFTDAGVTPVTINGQAVYQWSDKSGNNRHAIQATSGNRPTWNSPGFGLNGLGLVRVATGKRMGASRLTFAGDFTFFAVIKNASSLIAWMDNTNSTGLVSVAQTPLYYSGWSGWSSSLKSGAAPSLNSGSPFSGPSVLMFRRSGTTGTFSIGSTVYSGTYSTVPVLIDYLVGGVQDNISSDFQLAEQILYQSALNSSAEASVKSYLESKWGIT